MSRFLALILITLIGGSWNRALGQDADCEAVVPVVPTPLSEVVPQCLANRQVSSDPIEFISEDLEVCTCLETNNALFPEAASGTFTEKTVLEKLRTEATTYGNNRALESLSHAMNAASAGQQLITYTGADIRAALVREVQSNLRRSGEKPEAPAEEQTTTKNRSLADEPARQGSHADVILKRQLSADEIDAAGPRISDGMASVNDIPESSRDTQCVTYLEYSAQREVPYDNSFFSFLASTTTFNESDWKIESLQSAYDATSEASVRQSILARMTFLSRNSRLASLFRASPSEGITQDVLNARKRELFNIIRRLAPASGSSCANTPNGCWREAQSAGNYNQYSNETEQFLLRDDVTDIISAQSTRDYLTTINRVSTGAHGSVPSTARGYADYLQAQRQEIIFSCAGPSAPADCYDRFAGHCSQVRRIHKDGLKAVAETGAEVIQELTAAEQVHGLLNPEQNMNFDSFNDMICLQNYQNAAGETSNYFNYRNRMCSGETPAPECEDRRALLARFLREYDAGGEAAQLGIRAGFADALKRPNFQTVTIAQIEAYNQISGSPRALRAQYGGGYPTVSPTGQILPPASASGTLRPATGAALAATPVSGAITPNAATTTVEPSETRRGPASLGENAQTSAIAQPGPSSSSVGASASAPRPLPLLPSDSTRPRTPLPPLPTLTPPQPNPSPAPSSNREPERERDTSPRLASSSIVSSPTPSPSTGGPAQLSAAPAGGGAAPIVEVPARRRTRSAGSLSAALLEKYGNSPQDPVTRFQQELIRSPAIPLEMAPETIANIINDPSVLQADQTVMDIINASDQPVVKLSLENDSEAPLVVYATKTPEGVTFGFTPPPPPSATSRAPASLGENEMNVRLQDQIYQQVLTDPASLAEYDNVVRSAMSLPGDVVRLNVISPGKDSISVYVDKRGSQPRFTLSDQQVIDAYRP